MKRLLEVCVDSLASCRAAIRGGADRLEFCSALALGGLTPYTELLKQLRDESDIEVRCLMRPRAGDFLYTNDEIRLMASQIKILRGAGANGFVIGCLQSDGMLDTEAMKPLVEAAEGTGLTLHRAIDVSRDLSETYFAAAECGIDTILTSGGAANCWSGRDMIGHLLKLRDKTNGPEILIGAGVNTKVIEKYLAEYPSARAFHMSGKVDLESAMKFRRKEVPMGLPGLDEWHIQQTSEANVRLARAALNK